MRRRTRRRMLHSTAGALLAGVAGCLGTAGSGDGQATPTAAGAAPQRTPTWTPPPTETRTPSPTPTPSPSPSPTATPTAQYDPAARIYFADEGRLPGNGVGVEAVRLGGADAIRAYFRDGDGHERWCLLAEPFDGASFYYGESGLFMRSYPRDTTWGGDSWEHIKWPRGESPTRTVATSAVFDGTERHLTTETGRV